MVELVSANFSLAEAGFGAMDVSGKFGVSFFREGSKVLWKWVPGPVMDEGSGSRFALR